MKRILLKLILVLGLALGLQTSVKAQLVYIPDTAFRSYLYQNFGACMVGDSIDANCPAVLNAQYIDVSNRGISVLDGIQVFVNDTMINCSGNVLYFLPPLPTSLKRLICSYNRIVSLPTLPASLTYLDCFKNRIYTLPTLPSSLEHLYCNQNQLHNLPTLPNSLKYLYCGENSNFTSLPTLSNSLIELSCETNLITNLPVLPSSLTKLYCYQNQIGSLPALPSNLTEINCSENLINYLLVPFPNSLQVFDCSANQIHIMPALPPSLTELYCHQNLLTSLPTLPNSLKRLWCRYNQLITLPALSTSLEVLECSSNQLTNLPSLPSTLKYLYCGGNQLVSFPPIPASLRYLQCGSNQLTFLPPLSDSLKYFNCANNQLTSLPALTDSLTEVYCYNNQLTSLPTLPNSLYSLFCDHNQLTSLPILPDSLSTLNCGDNPITCLPDLKNVTSIYFYNTLVSCIANISNVNYSNPPISSFPICNLFNTNGCEVLWNIEGTCYIDLDTNCTFGNNERGCSNQKINFYKNGVLDQQTYTNINGNYDFDTFSNDVYKTEIDTTGLPFEVNCPSTGFYLDTISTTDSIKYDRDFALKCKGTDLAAISIYSMRLVPAGQRTIKVQAGDFSNFYGLHCANGVCGTVSITINGACTYVSPASYALTPTTVNGNVLTYSIVDFGAISNDSTFDFNILVDTSALIGSQICITVNVYTNCVQELNYNNNQLTQCFTVVGSYDPNDKAVSPQTTLDINGNRWLTYTIRFQNTGTAEAENIYITDTLSNMVDISTFTLLSYSHQPMMQIYNDGLVKFNFPNIHLPDSNTNEPESHGYVQYKIRAKDTLSVGSIIENTANIFFDFNAPVVTNNTNNSVINCSIPPTNVYETFCGDEGYSFNGMKYYFSGIYRQRFVTSLGCDSIVRLHLTLNKSTITRSNDTLQATTLNAITYQWINCTSGTTIVGANTQTFNPTQSGSYAVVIDFGGCIDTSNCYYFSPVGINEINASNISIQPNPFNTELKITLDKNYNGVLEVYNMLGALITSEKLQGRNVTLNTSNCNAGMYILKVATNDGVVVKKVVKR